MTNPLANALQDGIRNEGSGIISHKIASYPKIYVEGVFDRKVLSRKWNKVRKKGEQITVIMPDKGGKKAVLKQFKKLSNDQKCFALVDMDHDFEGEYLINPRLIDTNPLVTLASHYFSDNSSANKWIEEIVNNYSHDTGLTNEVIDFIRNIATIKTWIKLFKGKEKVNAKNISLKWENIDKNMKPFVLLQDHVAGLVFDDKRLERGFQTYVDLNQENLRRCGINDHELFDAVCLWLENWNPHLNKRDIRIGFFEVPLMNKICKSSGDFTDRLREKILTGGKL